MSLDTFQKEVHDWTLRTFGGYDEEPTLKHLTQEVNELLESEEVEEAADCAILLCNYAARKDFSLLDAINRQLADGGWILPLLSALPTLLEELKCKNEPASAACMMLTLWAFCESKGVSLWHEMQKKHKINLKRKWSKDETGMSHHIEKRGETNVL